MKRTSFLPFLAAVSLVLALSAPARAAEIYKVHGSACQPSLSGRQDVEYNQWGISNASASPRVVHCPLVSQAFDEPHLVLQSADLTLYDRSTAADVECTVRVVTFFGQVIFEGLVKTSGGGPGTGPQYRGLFLPEVAATDHTVVASCVLPGAVGDARSVVTRLEVMAVVAVP
jgi:hypothetical protein